MTTRNPLTLSRSELYELVWSKPVTEVGRSIGLSDVAVAKRCREVQVPVPPRGYWAKVAAGQSPKKPALPKYRSPPNTGAKKQVGIAARAPVPSRCIPTEGMPSAREEPTITFHGHPTARHTNLDDTDTSVLLDPLHSELTARLQSLLVPADANENWIAGGTSAGTPTGWPEKLRSVARLPPINVHSKTSTLRARRLLTQLVHVAGQLGWRFVNAAIQPEWHAYHRRGYEAQEEKDRVAAHFVVHSERLFIAISERLKRTERPLTLDEVKEQRCNPRTFYYRNRYSYAASGELTVHVSGTSEVRYAFATLRDTARKPLELRISDVIRSLLQGALDIKIRRKAAAEEEKQRRVRELEQETIRRTRDAYRQVLAKVEAEAGAWERAQRLRRYIRAARRTLPKGTEITATVEGKSVDVLSCASEFADQIDPLSPVPRMGLILNPDDPLAVGETYRSEESQLCRFVARLLGGNWSLAAKHEFMLDGD